MPMSATTGRKMAEEEEQRGSDHVALTLSVHERAQRTGLTHPLGAGQTGSTCKPRRSYKLHTWAPHGRHEQRLERKWSFKR